MKRIFLLEDDTAIAMGLQYALEKEGYEVTLNTSIAQARLSIINQPFDLYLLDLTLPDGSGYEICKTVKQKNDLPVIFLTAYDDEVNVVMGFELGADDYITKPFRVKELMLRIQSVLRRYGSREDTDCISLRGITVYPKAARVCRGSEEITLTAMEYRLLMVLLNHRKQVLTRAQLLQYLWDIDGEFMEDNTLTVYIRRLRGKIEEDPNKPEIIKTIRGMGYMIQ